MMKEAVLHIPDSSYAFALDEQCVIIRLRTKRNDFVSCILFYGDRACLDAQFVTKQLPMKKVGSDQLFDYYECELSCSYTRICYYFLLENEKETTYYYGDSFHLDAKCDRKEYYQFPYVRREDAVQMPDWVNTSIIYQIFPDSFATGKRRMDRKSMQIKTETGGVCNSNHGGTLCGVLENLDYLSKLGINCIYLNPIFTATSYHKYDTADYFTVDPCLGTLEDLKLLVASCHRNGIRVILDGVFNHCGSHFFAFQDVLKKGKDSPYADWFYRLEFPVKYQYPPNYEAFGYERDMPKLNTGNPEVTEYFCKVGTYWIQEADIDGWRLDVANEVNHDFWRQFRKAVKSVKGDAFLIGEIWESAEQWLQGDQLDSAMNYQFLNLCRDFFAQHSITAKEFDEKLQAMLYRYKKPITYAQMNLLDSHDVTRFLSRCNGDFRRMKLAFFFMMTCVGIPTIFYGDEACIEGVAESEYRRPMPWSDNPEHNPFFLYLKDLIALRKEYEALSKGDFQTIYTDDSGAYAFIRQTKNEQLLVMLNNSEQEKLLRLPLNMSESVCCSLFPTETGEKSAEEIFKLSPMEGRINRIVPFTH